jgi:hypothetical protein
MYIRDELFGNERYTGYRIAALMIRRSKLIWSKRKDVEVIKKKLDKKNNRFASASWGDQLQILNKKEGSGSKLESS